MTSPVLALRQAILTATAADAELAAAMSANETYAGLATLAFARPITAQHWLQASNPSERWKWDFMFQDLPPVKGHNVQLEGLHLEGSGPNYIPLHLVKPER